MSKTYKTELHCHSSAVSTCGRITPERLAELYVAAGYTTVVLTDHFSPVTFSPEHYGGARDWRSMAEYFLSGYRRLAAAAAGQLHVLLGAEVRFDQHSGTDYLVYGLTEETLLEGFDGVFSDNAATLSDRVHAVGALLFQAHPFRDGMKVTSPAVLDGVEVFNGNPSHDSRNEIATFYADFYHLLPSSGSDLHRENAACGINGGILTEEPVKTNEELLSVLRERRYTLIRN